MLIIVFNYIIYGFLFFILKVLIKVFGDYWGKISGEFELIVRDNEFVCGVIDKV